jgi:outer membrane protein assembly factor BamB
VNEQITFYGVDAFIVFDCVASSFHCYSITTGQELWESESFADAPWDSATWASTWTVYGSETNDYENLYFMFPDGSMAALSLATGNTVWRSEPIPSTEYPNNAVPFVCGLVMVGGNLYGYAGYSILYQIDPMPRFGMMVCVDASTGEIEYTLNGGLYPIAAANGYVIADGMYDETIYCVGKGPTKTTVTAPDIAVPMGTTITIRGSVLDMSPAAQEYYSQVKFPNGVPAVSDEDINEFMDYLHMQNSTLQNNPPTPDGVPVKLYVVKPDGTEEWITTVTSNSFGNFAYEYVPLSEGIYSVIAKFDQSESYWPSSSQTSFTATPAASAGSAFERGQSSVEKPEPTVPEHPLISAELAIVIAVIAVVAACIIGAVAYIALKRRQ